MGAAGDPVDSDQVTKTNTLVPTPDRAKLAEASDVSPHPGADGLVQDELPRRLLNIDRFHQPCLLPGRIPDR